MTAISCVCTVMAVIDSRYSPPSSSRYGMSSALAEAQSPLSTQTWISAITFWMNSEGIEETTAAKRIQNTTRGASTG